MSGLAVRGQVLALFAQMDSSEPAQHIPLGSKHDLDHHVILKDTTPSGVPDVQISAFQLLCDPQRHDRCNLKNACRLRCRSSPACRSTPWATSAL